jgi:hypothetical protein
MLTTTAHTSTTSPYSTHYIRYRRALQTWAATTARVHSERDSRQRAVARSTHHYSHSLLRQCFSALTAAVHSARARRRAAYTVLLQLKARSPLARHFFKWRVTAVALTSAAELHSAAAAAAEAAAASDAAQQEQLAQQQQQHAAALAVVEELAEQQQATAAAALAGAAEAAAAEREQSAVQLEELQQRTAAEAAAAVAAATAEGASLLAAAQAAAAAAAAEAQAAAAAQAAALQEQLRCTAAELTSTAEKLAARRQRSAELGFLRSQAATLHHVLATWRSTVQLVKQRKAALTRCGARFSGRALRCAVQQWQQEAHRLTRAKQLLQLLAQSCSARQTALTLRKRLLQWRTAHRVYRAYKQRRKQCVGTAFSSWKAHCAQRSTARALLHRVAARTRARSVGSGFTKWCAVLWSERCAAVTATVQQLETDAVTATAEQAAVLQALQREVSSNTTYSDLLISAFYKLL